MDPPLCLSRWEAQSWITGYCQHLCRAQSLQSCLTLCDPMDCSPPVHGDSPGKNTGVGCQALLQGIFLTQGLNPHLLHYSRILYSLNHLGSQSASILNNYSTSTSFLTSMVFEFVALWSLTYWCWWSIKGSSSLYTGALGRHYHQLEVNDQSINSGTSVSAHNPSPLHLFHSPPFKTLGLKIPGPPSSSETLPSSWFPVLPTTVC